MHTDVLLCDGCGQAASSEHTARRLERLEWATRYRPVHIGTLLLGAVPPRSDEEFLYSGKFQGEAAVLLDAAGIATLGKTPEAVLSEFQRGGFFVTYVLECSLESAGGTNSSPEALLSRRVAAVAARIRRSLKPKRLILFSGELAPVAAAFQGGNLGCPVVLDDGKPYVWDPGKHGEGFQRLRELLVGAVADR